MTGRYLLDTSIVIPLLNGDQSVHAALAGAQEIAIPATVAGELYFGAEKSGHAKANCGIVARFLDQQSVLPCGHEVAREYGRIKGILKKRGTPIPENDIWIAATAIYHDLILVSRDAHFRKIEALQAETW